MFLKPQYKCAELTQSLISKLMPPFSIIPFLRNILTPRSGSTNGKKECQLPPCSFKIKLKITSSHGSLNSLEVYLAPVFLYFC